MTGLGEWLKQIVMLVMLGVITDLLLPGKAMQKYVRTVVGLAVIAAMLQPIVPFFKGDWANQIATMATREITGTGGQGGSGAPMGTDGKGVSQAGPEGNNLQQNAAVSVPSTLASQLQSVMNSQTASTADSILSQQLAAGIASAFHQNVTVHVRGAGPEGNTIYVQIDAPNLSSDMQHSIQKWVAETLQTPLNQIQIGEGGGGESYGP